MVERGSFDEIEDLRFVECVEWAVLENIVIGWSIVQCLDVLEWVVERGSLDHIDDLRFVGCVERVSLDEIDGVRFVGCVK